jgi:hypothetical protein
MTRTILEKKANRFFLKKVTEPFALSGHCRVDFIQEAFFLKMKFIQICQAKKRGFLGEIK